MTSPPPDPLDLALQLVLASGPSASSGLLKLTISGCVDEIDRQAVAALNVFQTAALACFLMDVGHGGPERDGLFRLRTGQPSKLWRFVQTGQYAAAADQFGRWPNPSYPGRREAERALFLRTR